MNLACAIWWNGRSPPVSAFSSPAEPRAKLLRRRSFARGSAGDEKADTGGDLPFHQIAQARFIHTEVRTKRGNERGAAALKFHRGSNSRISKLKRNWPRMNANQRE